MDRACATPAESRPGRTEAVMSRVCESCGKKSTIGNQIATRGLAKYKGGVGIKTTGINKRWFRPNVQRVRVLTKEGTVTRMKVCAKCMTT